MRRHVVISMIMTSVIHTVDGCLYVECVCMCVHVCCCLHIQICVRVHRDWCFEAFVDVKILGAGDDLLSSAAYKPQYAQLKGLR